MRKLLILILIALTCKAIGQSASFTEIKRKPLPEKYRTDSFTIFYPVVLLKDMEVANKINQAIKEEVFALEDSTLHSTDSLLDDYISYFLTDMYYEAGFNKNGILSLCIYAEGSAAYPNNFSFYLNFDLITGRRLTLKDIITEKRYSPFEKEIRLSKKKILDKHKTELKALVANNEIDKDTYKVLLENMSDCYNTVSLAKFRINDTEIEITDECEFSHALRALQPGTTMAFKLSTLKSILKPDFIRKLMH